MFRAFDDYLGGDWGVDFWSQVGMDDCVRMLSGFDEETWGVLSDRLSSRPAGWLRRCADVLGQWPCEKSRDLLIRIALASDHDAAVAALDSLRDFEAQQVSLAGHEHSLMARIQTLMAHADPIDLIVLRSFSQDLSAPRPDGTV